MKMIEWIMEFWVFCFLFLTSPIWIWFVIGMKLGNKFLEKMR